MTEHRHHTTSQARDFLRSEVHLCDIELEFYSLNRLHPAFFPPMEEHLLWCESYANRLEAFDEYHTVLNKRYLCKLVPVSAHRA